MLLKYLMLSLTSAQKLKIIFFLTLRILLVAVDVFSLILLGLLASSVGGSQNGAGVLFDILSASIDDKNLLVITLSLFISKGFVAHLINMSYSNFISKVEASIAAKYLNGYFSSGLEGFDKFAKSKIAHTLIDSTSAGIGQSLSAFSIIFTEGLQVATISIFLTLTDPSLFAFVGTIFVLTGIILHFTVNKRISKAASVLDQSRIDLVSFIYDMQMNFRQIYTQRQVDKFTEKFVSGRRLYSKKTTEIVALTLAPKYVLEIALVAGIAFVVSPAGTSAGVSLNATSLVIFSAGIFRLVASLLPLQNQINLLQRFRQESRLALQIETMLSSTIPTKSNAVPTNPDLKPILKVNNLSFEYIGAETPVIRNLTANLKFGSLCVISGPSGSGKSTLVDLLVGLRKPTSGDVAFLDSASGFEISKESISISYVPQNLELITGTLRQNLLLDPGATPDAENDMRIANTLREVELTALLNVEKEGLDRKLTKSSKFSGGQTQRIGIARALLNNPQLLIIDEGTSSLDQRSKNQVISTLDKLRGKVTMIVISHGKNEFRNADAQIIFDGLGSATFVTNG